MISKATVRQDFLHKVIFFEKQVAIFFGGGPKYFLKKLYFDNDLIINEKRKMLLCCSNKLEKTFEHVMKVQTAHSFYFYLFPASLD